MRLISLSVLLAVGLSAQERPGYPHAPYAVLVTDSAPFQKLLDLDGDGDTDAVGVRINQSSLELNAWYNNGSGWLRQVVRHRGGGARSNGGYGVLAVGDLNNNGRDDVVVAGSSASVQVYSDFNAQLFDHRTENIPHAAFDVAVGDFDGDGTNDIGVTSASDSRVTIILATGSKRTASLAPSAGAKLGVGDLDGDGVDDLAVWRDGVLVPVHAVGGSLRGGTPIVSQIATAPGRTHMWAVGRLDGDADDDVVTFLPGLGNNIEPVYETFLQDAGRFDAQDVSVGGPAEYLADIDGDGDLDGVCCGGGGGGTRPWPKLDFASTFEFAINEGDGKFGRSFQFPGAGSVSLAGVADLDGDGDMDVVAGRCVFYGRGPWTESPMPRTHINPYVMRDFLVRDLERDGDPDLFPNPYGGSINRGDGHFELTRKNGITPPAGTGVGGGISTDFDGDGAVDVVYQLVRQGQFEAMVLARNSGGGTWEYAGPVMDPGIRIGQGYTIDHARAADCDGDGLEDLIDTANPSRNGYSFRIAWNNGTKYELGWGWATARLEHVADFDQDGIPDLLLRNAGQLRIARGIGQRDFAPPELIISDLDTWRANTTVVGDVTGDGRVDIVTPNADSKVTVWMNRSVPGLWDFERSFTEAVAIGSSFPNVSIGDFNGDGDADVVYGPVESQGPNIARLLMRDRRGGGFGFERFDIALPSAGFTVDVDADGDDDLVGEYVAFGSSRWPDEVGRHVQYGGGTPGEVGAVPVLGLRGQATAGGTKTLTLTNITGPTVGLLGFNVARADLPDFILPGLHLLIDPSGMALVPWLLNADGEGRAAGEAEWTIPMPIDSYGVAFYDQAFVADPAAPSGVAASNGLEIRVGR